MTITIDDVDEGIGTIISATDIITEEEYADVLTAHLARRDDTFKGYRYSICDYTAIAKLEISLGAISQIEDCCVPAATFNPNVIVAIVADRDLHFALATMANSKRNETAWENEVFRCRKEAENWVRERVQQKFGITDLTFR